MKRRHKFSGQRCVYCGAAAETSDHAIAKKFFLVERRDSLPQVPACWSCNNKKSQLERYLMAVLPFGAKHSDAAANLATLVPARLEKDAKLRRKLEKGLEKSGGTSIPIDHKQLEGYLAMVAIALAWKHYGVHLPEGYSAIASLFRDTSHFAFRDILSRLGNQVYGDLGNGTFSYIGSQLRECPELTVWRFWFYGGVKFR